MKFLLIIASLSFALAEPPVPSGLYGTPNRYVPPQNEYLPPQNRYIPPSAPTAPPAPRYIPPSTNYGVPAQTTAVVKPNTEYGAPSTSYGAPSSSYGAPSTSYGAPSSTYGAPSGGYGRGGPDYPSEPANYEFEYHVQDAQSGNDFGHKEQRQGDVAQGKYFVLLPDGRLQTVEYTADQNGYKPKISYQQVGGGYSGGGYSGGGYPSSNGGYQY